MVVPVTIILLLFGFFLVRFYRITCDFPKQYQHIPKSTELMKNKCFGLADFFSLRSIFTRFHAFEDIILCARANGMIYLRLILDICVSLHFFISSITYKNVVTQKVQLFRRAKKQFSKVHFRMNLCYFKISYLRGPNHKTLEMIHLE